MPRISSFYGIVIAMYYRDHHPPHFHAIYARAGIHRTELEANWARAEAHLPLDTIEPLP